MCLRDKFIPIVLSVCNKSINFADARTEILLKTMTK